ncbi:MAG: RnfABCDGE type electron transport complex subunit D [Eubacteriales bacterium]|nr:RnfABCDGE type electron transport complex subunit D [Eubacteriales bacterium]MDD4682350.1 RnfABCDGE type electron transport complex subunit D [Eubacteriales bacterium]
MIKLKDSFLKQKMMTRVLFSLLPILLLSIYFFGLRTLVLLSVVTITGILSEYGIMRLIDGDKAKVSEALLVTCLLFTLTLPPSVPYWVAAVGIAFGVVFGKCAFGGFGKNIFNPALVGRCLIYVSFPAHMTVAWAEPYSGFPGGLIRWSAGVDAMTSATPMIMFNKEGIMTDYLNLFFGNIAGSLGETSALLIIAAAVYLIMTKTASWKIIVSCAASFASLGSILYLTGVIETDPLFSILSGGFLFAAVFMATDPISAPKQETSKYIYGALIGVVAIIIRSFSLFTEGIMFAILIVNAFVPLIDRNIKIIKDRKKAGKKVTA